MEFKEKIKELRKQNGLSQGDLAKITGVQQTSISNIENGITGKEIIKVGIAQKIAKALNISFNELFEIEIPSSNNDKIVELENKITILEKLVSDQKENLSILREQNELLKPYRQAYIQELSIGEVMIIVTAQKVREAIQQGEEYTLTSNDIRKEAIACFKKENPDLNLDDFYFVTPQELKSLK
jgi:transcriptional regulator with XRE-family HTH domain